MALPKHLAVHGAALPVSPPASVRCYDILTYQDGTVTPGHFLSCRELTLTMHLNGAPFVRVACSGQHLQYLVPGFLYSCGVIETLEDVAAVDMIPLAAGFDGSDEAGEPPVEEMRVDVQLRGVSCCKSGHSQNMAAPKLTITSAMGWNIPVAARRLRSFSRPPAPTWNPRLILRAAQELEERSEVFHQTGGCHNAALVGHDGMVFYCLDIGRHNAIDTLVGYMLVEGLDPSRHMIISSGRIASEIAQKAVRAGVPVFASLSRAMSRAVDMARSTGLTLLGNVTSGSMHIYHENGQLILP